MKRTVRILRVCRLEYVSESESGDVPVFFPALTIPEGLNMCAHTAGMLPKPRLYKRGYQRIRVGGRDFTLGKPGSQEADERYKAVLLAWAEGSGNVPDDFKFDPKPKKQKTLKTTKHVPDPDQICVADLLCAAFVNVKEKSWRW